MAAAEADAARAPPGSHGELLGPRGAVTPRRPPGLHHQLRQRTDDRHRPERPGRRLSCQAEGPGAPLRGRPRQQGGRRSAGLWPTCRTAARSQLCRLGPSASEQREQGPRGVTPPNGPSCQELLQRRHCASRRRKCDGPRRKCPPITQTPDGLTGQQTMLPDTAFRHPVTEMPRPPSPRSSHPSSRHQKYLSSNSPRSAGSSPFQTRRKRQAIIKMMKERTLQNGIICPERWSFRIEGERKFRDKQRLKNFKTIKRALQEMFKGLP